MYEQELAEIQVVADTIIDQYEQVFGVDYGLHPHIAIAGLDEFKEILLRQSEATESKISDRDAITLAGSIRKTSFGIYDPYINTLFISDKLFSSPMFKEEGQLEYTIAHELAHGFEYNYCTFSYEKIVKDKLKSPDFKGKDMFFNYEIMCEAFAEMALKEGMAEYMTTTMYAQTKENNSISAKGHMFSQKNMKNYSNAQKELSKRINEVIALKGHVENRQLNIEDWNLINHRVNPYKYQIGYGFIENQIEKGHSLIDILEHPPRELKDLLPED